MTLSNYKEEILRLGHFGVGFGAEEIEEVAIIVLIDSCLNFVEYLSIKPTRLNSFGASMQPCLTLYTRTELCRYVVMTTYNNSNEELNEVKYFYAIITILFW